MESGAPFHEPLAVLAAEAEAVLARVQRHEALVDERRRAAEAEDTARTAFGPHHQQQQQQQAEGQEGEAKAFPSWSVRSRLSRSDASRNFIRLPSHILDASAQQQQLPHSQNLSAASDASLGLPPAPEIPAFLADRTLADALLVVSSFEGVLGAPSLLRDATALQCVLELLNVPPNDGVAARPVATGVKPAEALVADARAREMGAIVAKHRAFMLSQATVARLTRLEHRSGRWVGALRLMQHTVLGSEGGGGSATAVGVGGRLGSPSPLERLLVRARKMCSGGAADRRRIAQASVDDLEGGGLEKEADTNAATSSSASPRAAVPSSVPRLSPAMISTGIEVFAAANRWEVALDLIERLPGSLWREADVGGVIRSLARSRAPGAWEHALKVYEDAARRHGVRLSSPAHVNNLLGMLGRARKTEEAASIVERFVRLDVPSASTSSASAASDSSSSSVASIGCLSDVASEPLQPPLPLSSFGLAADGGGGDATVLQAQQHPSESAPPQQQRVEANAYTISQICVAFRHQWGRALSYASAIIARNAANPSIVDGVALAKLTLAASEGQSWAHGLGILRLSEQTQTPLDAASYAAIAKLIDAAGREGRLGGPEEAREQSAYLAACVRRHHSPEVFAKVLNTLIQTSPLGREEVAAAKAFVTAAAGNASMHPIGSNGIAAVSTTAVPVASRSAEEGEASATTPTATTAPATAAEKGNGADVLSMHYATLMAHGCHVETASLHRLLEAHCRNGDWAEGLRFMAELRGRGAATAAGHDAVQYAMLAPRAGLSQPHWRVAVGLYDAITAPGEASDVMAADVSNGGPLAELPPAGLAGAAAAVPLSEVAFRSCIRLCFQQGAAEAAQRLLRDTMKRGIGTSFRR